MKLNLGWGLGSGLVLVWGLASSGCTPGYIKASDLSSRGQGPAACAKSCEDLQMRMVAMVLVGDDVPGCVCEITPVAPLPGAAPLPPPPAANQGSDGDPGNARFGAAASTGGYVVIAAAAARAQQQQQQQQQQRQQTVK